MWFSHSYFSQPLYIRTTSVYIANGGMLYAPELTNILYIKYNI